MVSAVPSQMAIRLLLIVPRDQAAKLWSLAEELADVPGCEVIIDRRVTERRKGGAKPPGEERRSADRRSDRLDRPGIRVLFVY
jgi:hypothetical protein